MTSKCSDQTALMCRLYAQADLSFAGRTYHIVGNLMSRLIFILKFKFVILDMFNETSLAHSIKQDEKSSV